jgi:putative phosphoribosyl transferase
VFHDRTHAGRALGRLVAGSLAAGSLNDAPVIVLALPRGGVPVGVEVARALPGTLFDIFLVRKLGVPDREELAFGAIASGGIRVLNHALIDQADLSEATIDRIARQEQIELDRREKAYREARQPLDSRDRVVVLVDDGLATGATMMAAVQAVRMQEPRRVVVAVPVASREACHELRTVAGEVICAQVPHPFYAVGCWYRNFEQVSDHEVRNLLRRFTKPSNTPRTVLLTDGSTAPT